MLARILHLVRYDVQSATPILAVWIGALAIESLVYWTGPPAPDPVSRQTVNLDLAVIVIRFALTVVLVASLVHRHPLVGTTAFWRTRPVARGELLLAKGLGISLLAVALPVAWFGLTFFGLGFGSATAARAAFLIGIEQASVAAFVVALAAVSSNLAQIVVGGIAMLMGFGQGRMWMGTGQRRPQPWTFTTHDQALAEGSFFIIVAVILTAVAIHQLFTMKRWRSVVLMAAAVVLALLQFRLPLVVWEPLPLPEPAAGLAGIPQLELVPSTMRSEHFRRNDGTGAEAPKGSAARPAAGVRYSAQVREAGQPGAVFLVPARLRASITFADGETLAWALPPLASAAQLQPVSGGGTPKEQPYASLAAAAGASLLVDPRDVSAERYGIQCLEVSDDVFGRKRSAPGVLDITVAARAYRYSWSTRVPVAEPSRAEAGDLSFVFRGRTATENGVAFDVGHARFPSWTASPATYYLLRHRGRREALLLVGAGETTYRTTVMLYGGLTLVRRRLEAMLADRPVVDVVDEQWLREAELIVAVPDMLGRVDRTIRIEGFLLDRGSGLPADPAGILTEPGDKK